MKKMTILQAILVNPYRSQVPKGYYNKLRGHTGEDRRAAIGDILLSPVTGTVMRTATQPEMGKVLYLRHDETGDIHVFAHLSAFLVGVNDKVTRLQPLMATGNTGSKTTIPHVHWEIITQKPVSPIDKVMTRKLYQFVGFNTHPSNRLKEVYKPYGIDPITGQSGKVPHNPNGF